MTKHKPDRYKSPKTPEQALPRDKSVRAGAPAGSGKRDAGAGKLFARSLANSGWLTVLSPYWGSRITSGISRSVRC
jgi:hypothetical protein